MVKLLVVMDQEFYQEMPLIILDNWVLDNLILTDKLLAKDLQGFTTCLLVNNNLFFIIKIVFHIDDSLKIASASFSLLVVTY